MLKGVWNQEGSLWGGFYASRASIWGLIDALTVVKGVQASFIDTIPSLPFNFLFPRSLYEWAIVDEMFSANIMVAAFFICLGVLNSPCQAYHELFHNSFDSARIITLLAFIITCILFFQMGQMHRRLLQDGLVALEFPQGEETGSPWFGRIISCLSSLPSQLLGWCLSSLSKFLPADLPSDRLPSLSVTWEAHHKSDLSLTLPLDQGESNQGRKLLKPGDALKDGCPSPIQFLYLPSVVGIAPGSVCLMLSHCYIVFIQDCQHIVQGYICTGVPH